VRSSRLIIENFKGIDLTNQPAGVDISRSCSGSNMIRDVPGKVRKRMGYYLKNTYDGAINGIYSFKDRLIVHAGSGIYADAEKIWDAAADGRSFAVAVGGEMWFLDGKRLLRIKEDGDKITASPADEGAYVPTVSLGRRPSGGGTALEPINLLTPRLTDSFLGTAEDTAYQLSFDELSDAAVSVRRMSAPEVWETLAEGADFSVDREGGVVTFTSPPGESPVTGEDNIEITYSLAADSSGDIHRCRFGICYGAFGAADRLFIAGDPQHPARDRHCAPADPTYWGDIWYSELGLSDSPIMGYSIVDGALAAHKSRDDHSRNILLRRGEKTEDGVEFPICGIIQGEGAISPWTFGFMKEPLFLTENGICATTPYEYSGERYIQQRSFYLNGGLLKEEDLADACCCIYKDFYLLAVGGKVYVLDTLCKDAGTFLRSDYQYEGYLLENIDARCIACCDGALLFGDGEGRLMQFHRDTEDIESYTDMGEPIKARWDIDFSGKVFYHKKTLRRVAVRLAAYANTSVSAYRMLRGVWRHLFSEMAGARFFSFSNLAFGKWTFSSDLNPKTLVKRAYVRGADALRLSFRNEEAREPFGIFQLALEFSEGGNYKGA